MLHPEHLESLVKTSKAAPTGAVVSGRWRRFTVVADKVRVGPIVCAPPDRRGLDTLAEILEPMGEGSICGHSLLWPRALLAKVPWDERLSANGDIDFFGRAILAGAQIVGRPVGMAYYRVHQGDRVSSATALRRPISAAQYRLKWSQLLLSHPEHEIFAPAMRNGFMALLIALSGLPEARALVPILKDAYWLWGGEGYFVSNPPSNPFKRVARGQRPVARRAVRAALAAEAGVAAGSRDQVAAGDLLRSANRRRQGGRDHHPLLHMKLKVYFKPALPVGLLVAAACLFWIAFVTLGSGPGRDGRARLGAVLHGCLPPWARWRCCALPCSSGGRIGRARRGCSSSLRMRTIA